MILVKAVSSNPAYKVLTKEEYDILMSKHAGGSPKKADPKVLTSTPDAKKVQFEGAGSKLLSFINKGQAPSPVPRFTLTILCLITLHMSPVPMSPNCPHLVVLKNPKKGRQHMKCGVLRLNASRVLVYCQNQFCCSPLGIH